MYRDYRVSRKMVNMCIRVEYTGWPKKVSHYQIIKKLCQIILKSANEIIFLRQIKK